MTTGVFRYGSNSEALKPASTQQNVRITGCCEGLCGSRMRDQISPISRSGVTNATPGTRYSSPIKDSSTVPIIIASIPSLSSTTSPAAVKRSATASSD